MTPRCKFGSEGCVGDDIVGSLSLFAKFVESSSGLHFAFYF